MKHRILWLDSLKGLGIIFIIIIHSTGSNKVYEFLTAFALPLFFFVSGFTFRRDNDTEWTEFLLKKLRTRLLPYAVSCAIFFLIVMAQKFRSLGEGSIWLMNLIKFESLAGFLMGDYYWLLNTIYNGPLWFLVCLFWVENIFYFMSYISGTLQIGVLLLVFSCGAQYLFSSTLSTVPFVVNKTTVYILFYGSGFIANTMRVNNKIPRSLLWGLLIALSIWGCWRWINTDITRNNKFIYSFLFSTLDAFTGIIAFALLSRLLAAWNWLRFFGTNTLIILLLFEPLRRMSCDIFSLASYSFFDYLFNSYRELFTLLQVTTILLLTIPFILTVNNYLPGLQSKRGTSSRR